MPVTATPVTAASATLDAVNEMLEAIGEPPATSLDTGGTSEVAEAETILTRVRKQMLTRGWAANTLVNRKHAPTTGTKKVSFSSSVLGITAPTDRYGWRVGGGPKHAFAMRNLELYDLEDNVSTWDENVYLNVIEDVAFTQLPPALRDYVTATAAVEFQRYKRHSVRADSFWSQKAGLARLRAEQEDSDLRQTNLLDSPEMQRVKGHRNESMFNRSGA